MPTQAETAATSIGECETQSCPARHDARLPALGEAPVEAITSWLSSREANDFPFDAVVAEFHRVGKHFVSTELLEALAGVRASLSDVRGPIASVRLLDRFLDSALDKYGGRYANPTYLGLSLLPLPSSEAPSDEIVDAERRYDRLLVQLVADALRFEIAAAQGESDLLPQLRPDVRTTAKRCRLGLQVAGPATLLLGLSGSEDSADPIAAARRLWANVAGDFTIAERRVLQLTMLPVSLVHDEYQFIRILQSFEATFALVAVQLSAAIQALTDGVPDLAVQRIRAAASALRQAAPLFSLLATMQVDAFQAFRVFTEGASAIQSRNYKLMESLCRQPDPARLDSTAYHSVPEVREQVLAGHLTVDAAFEVARAAGCLSAPDVYEVEQAMRQFAATLHRWRRTHYRIAVRMLGEHTGTGYTEGSPYLKAAQSIPVFLSIANDEGANDTEATESDQGGEIAPARNRELVSERARCPFAA